MKKIKENKGFILTGIILIIIISLIAEIIIGNLGTTINKVKKEDQLINVEDLELKNFTLNEDGIISQSDKNSFTIKLNKKYVEKFKFNYKANDNPKFRITVKGYNNNNKRIKVTKESTHTVYSNLVEKKIDFKVEEIKVTTYNKDVTINNITIDNSPIFNVIRFIVILFFLLTIFVIVCYRKFKFNNLAILYAFIATLIGITMICASPCIAAVSWDEAIHYNNTNSLFRGISAEQKGYDYIISSPGISLPTTYEENTRFKEVVNNEKDLVYEILVGTNVVAFDNIIYIPMSLTRRAAELVGFSPTFQFYLGKIVCLLVFVLLMAYSIHIAKYGKTMLFTLGLLPLLIFQAISYSKDGLIVAGITLSMVAFMNVIVDKNSKVDFKFVFLFIVPMLIACLAKPNYFPLFLLGLFIPKDRFKDIKQKRLFNIIVVIITLLVLSTFAVQLVFNNSNMGDSRGEGHVSVSEQIKVIVHNPINYLNIWTKNVLNTFSRLFSNNISSVGYLGNSTYYLGNVFIILLFFSLFVKEKEEENKVLPGIYKLLLLFTLLVILFGISLALYLEFTAVGTNLIDGVQPRYYLPLVYLLLGCLITPKIKTTFNRDNAVFGIALLSTIAFYFIIFELYIWNIYW